MHRPNCSHTTASPHIRVEKNDFVATRYLLVFTDEQRDSGNAHHNAMTVRTNPFVIDYSKA